MFCGFKGVLAGVAAAVALSSAPAVAAVTTITFDEFATDETLATMGTFTSGGYRFESSNDAPDAYLVWGRDNASNIDPGGASITTMWSDTRIKVSRTDGELFALKSIDLADLFNENLGGQLVQLEFFGPEYTLPTWQIVQIPTTPGGHTFTFDRSGLSSFNIIPFNTFFGLVQFDNVVVDGPSVAPEPGAWALMILGFGAAGSAVRRQRRAGTLVRAL